MYAIRSYYGHTTGAKVSASNFYMADFAVDDFTIDGTPSVVCTPPTQQATTFAAAPVGETTMTVSWSGGNGNNTLVLASTSPIVTRNNFV